MQNVNEITTLKEQLATAQQMERTAWDSAAYWQIRAEQAESIVKFYDQRNRNASQAQEAEFLRDMETLIKAWKAKRQRD